MREVDPDANLVYVLKRGFFSSTAAAHSTGDLVRNQPRFPRQAIKRALNSVILSVYPDLFAVGATELTSNAGTATYALPTDLEEVLDVLYDNDDGTSYWSPLTRYRVNMHANTDAFASGKTIDLFDGMNSGHIIQVRYRKVPTVLEDGDTLTDSGLQESAKETLVYGACARLVGYTEQARINDDSAEARFIDGSPAGQALNVARYFY